MYHSLLVRFANGVHVKLRVSIQLRREQQLTEQQRREAGLGEDMCFGSILGLEKLRLASSTLILPVARPVFHDHGAIGRWGVMPGSEEPRGSARVELPEGELKLTRRREHACRLNRLASSAIRGKMIRFPRPAF